MPNMIKRSTAQEIMQKLESVNENKPVFLQIAGDFGTGKTSSAKAIQDYLKKIGFTVAYAEATEKQFGVFEQAVQGGILEELVIEKPISINNVFFTNQFGTMMASASSEGFETDNDIIASMNDAVQNFVKDSLSNATNDFVELISDRSFNMFQYDDYKIATLRAPYGALTCLFKGDVPETLNVTMNSILNHLENSEYSSLLESWDGNLSTVEGMAGILKPLLEAYKFESSSFYEKEYRTIETFLNKISRFKKTAFILEDIENADDSSVSLLNLLPKNLEGNYVVVVTSKKGLKLKNYDLLEFENFSPEESKKFINSCFDLNPPPDDFADHLFEKTQGNPALLNKNMELLNKAGFNFWNWKSELKEKNLEVFSSMSEITKSELGELDKNIYGSLEYLSLLGNAFSEADISEIKPEHISHLLNKGIIKKTEQGYVFAIRELVEQVYKNISDENLFLRMAATYEQKPKNMENMKKLAGIYHAVAVRTKNKEHAKKAFEHVSEWCSKISQRKEKFDENPILMGRNLLDILETPDAEKVKFFETELLAFAVNNRIDNLYSRTDELFELAEKTGDNNILALSAYYLTRRKYKKRQLKEADKFLKEILEKLEGKDLNPEYMGKLLFQKAVNLRELYSEEKNIEYLNESIETLEKLIASDLVLASQEVRIRSKLELINVYVTDYRSAEKLPKEETAQKIINYITEMEEILENEVLEKDTVKGIYFNLSNKEVALGNYDKAIILNKKIMNMSKEYEITSISDAINNILWANLMKGNYDEVVNLYKQYYPVAERYDVPIKDYFKENYAIALMLIGMENLIESSKVVPLESINGDLKNKPEFFIGLDHFVPGTLAAYFKKYSLTQESHNEAIAASYKKHNIEPKETEDISSDSNQ